MPDNTTATSSGEGPVDAVDVTTEIAETVPAATATTPRSIDPIEVGVWDWGTPCRVEVRQDLALDGLGFERSFLMEISTSPRGVRLDFTDVVLEERSFTDAEVAEYLFDHLQVLPSVLLDDDGNFLNFVGLDEALRDLYGQTDRPEPFPYDDVALVERFVRDSTVNPWFGFWVGSDSLAEDADSSMESRSFSGVGYLAEVTVSAAHITSEPQIAQYGGKAARFVYNEVGEDVVLADGVDTVSLEIQSKAILEADRLRPLETDVFVTIFSTTSSERRDPFRDGLFRLIVQSYFDWGTPANCQ